MMRADCPYCNSRNIKKVMLPSVMTIGLLGIAVGLLISTTEHGTLALLIIFLSSSVFVIGLCIKAIKFMIGTKIKTKRYKCKECKKRF